jgi:hypothetical protein
MTDHDPASIPALAGLIDQVVDGDLTPAQLKRAICELDKTKDGWRQCGLAFVEAQAWAEAFHHLDDEMREIEGRPPRRVRAASPGMNRSPNIPATAISSRPIRRRVGDALAAGIAFVAFSLGWLSHGLRIREGSETPMSSPASTRLSKPSTDQVAHRENRASSEIPDETARSEPLERVPTVREVARLRIGNGDPASAEVPILTGPAIDERWLLEQPPPFSGYGLAVWQRQGYQLDQRRRVVSVPLGDGRQAAVPIDHVQLRYVGHTPL